ncbi:hypothetical protein TNCV_4790431 [Trichonephila clavipes]|nr:hypothetical protein TNCV_4790431 [Trichonephila clavipes]
MTECVRISIENDKKKHYVEVLRRLREKIRPVKQQNVDYAPRLPLDAHCALCKVVLGGQIHYCARASIIFTRPYSIRLLHVS